MSFRSAPSCRRLLVTALLVGSPMLASEARAALVSLDLTNVGSPGQNITGINSGLASGTRTIISNFVPGGEFKVLNNYVSGPVTLMGFNCDGEAGSGVSFQFAAGFTTATPQNFGANVSIDAASATSWTSNGGRIGFSNGTSFSADFGANSFMGFRFGSNASGWNYGFLEVLWDSSGTAGWNTTGAAAFKILSGAYESQVNTAIMTPAGGGGGGGVPLPGAAGLAACGLLATGRRRRR